jgi:integration host factor subunit beta
LPKPEGSDKVIRNSSNEFTVRLKKADDFGCFARGDLMTKADLVNDVANAAELTKKDAERLVEIVFESIIDSLNSGEKIELRGFGSFRVRSRGARRGRNPKTGDPVDIPAKRVPYFKAGKELKELINEPQV